MVDLPGNLIERRPGELSGGQKQRVCIARALAAEPDLMICDEVTSSLDPLVADGILRLLQRIQADMGLAFLFITHDLGLVRRVANRMTVMLEGEVVAEGAVENVFSPPYHPYTGVVAFLGTGAAYGMARRGARKARVPDRLKVTLDNPKRGRRQFSPNAPQKGADLV